MRSFTRIKDTALYNAAIADYNDALAIFNTFLNYRNNRFTPVKTDSEIQAIFEGIEKGIASAKLKLNEVNHSKAGLTLNTSPLEKALDDLSAHVKRATRLFKRLLEYSEREVSKHS